MDPVVWYVLAFCAAWAVGCGLYIILATVRMPSWRSQPTMIYSPEEGGKRGVMSKSIEQECNDIRSELKDYEERLRALAHDNRYDAVQSYPNQHNEMRAQTMLAVRAVEDARMRVGKILQYADDGVSILDK